jgi:hypothetical protein
VCVVTKHAGARVLAGRIAWNRSGGRPATKCVVTGSKPWGTCEKTLTRREATARLKRHSAFGSTSFNYSKSRRRSQQQPDAACSSVKRVAGFRAKPKRPNKPTDVFQTCSRLPLRLAGSSKRPITALGVSSCCVLCHASPVSAQLAAEAVFFATAKRQCSVHPNLIPARYLSDTCLNTRVTSGRSRVSNRTSLSLADKILDRQKSVTVSTIDSTERACGHRPCRAISSCVQLVTPFSG